MKNIPTLILMFCSIIFFVGCTNSTKEEKKPNVIVFLVDDLGLNETSLAMFEESTNYNKRYRTPNLNELAEQGIVFTNARANAICVPSRVSLLTGQNFMRHQVKGDIITQFNKRKTLEFPEGKVIAEVENMLPNVLKKKWLSYNTCRQIPYLPSLSGRNKSYT